MDWFLVISILATIISSTIFVTKGALFQKINSITQQSKTSISSEGHAIQLFESYAASGVTSISFDLNDSINQIPSEISLVTSLEELYIKDIPILGLPSSIDSLPALRIVDIRGTAMAEIPPQLGNLQSLSELYLPDNQITTITLEITKLQNLSILDLSGNPLSKESVEELKTLMPNAQIIFNDL